MSKWKHLFLLLHIHRVAILFSKGNHKVGERERGSITHNNKGKHHKKGKGKGKHHTLFIYKVWELVGGLLDTY